jgi:hypothetical protein
MHEEDCALTSGLPTPLLVLMFCASVSSSCSSSWSVLCSWPAWDACVGRGSWGGWVGGGRIERGQPLICVPCWVPCCVHPPLAYLALFRLNIIINIPQQAQSLILWVQGARGLSRYNKRTRCRPQSPRSGEGEQQRKLLRSLAWECPTPGPDCSWNEPLWGFCCDVEAGTLQRREKEKGGRNCRARGADARECAEWLQER